MRYPELTVERFWAKVAVDDQQACWPWLAGVTAAGYGFSARRKKLLLAHRVAFFLANGDASIDEALGHSGAIYILHRCDNPPCCNPNHLFAGTPSANMQDMHDKWRSPRKRLSDADVAEIRRLHGSKQASTRRLAALFGVSQTHVGNIILGKARSTEY